MTEKGLESGRLEPSVRIRLAGAWCAELWERAWRALWSPVAAAGAFAGFALTDALPTWPGLVHATLLLAVATVIAFLAARGFRTFQWPSRIAARRRLESTAPELHRPLTAVEDVRADSGAAMTTALWDAHRRRAEAALAALRASSPSPGVAARDRYALRAAAMVALAIGLIGAGADTGPRLVRALTPTLGAGDASMSARLWLTPPAYTNKSPIYLEHPAPATSAPIARLTVPEGSKVLAVVSGTSRATDLAFDGAVRPLERIGDGGLRLETQILAARRLALSQRGREIAGWDFDIIPDLPPEIAFARQPREAGRGRVRIDYRAADDYGIGPVTALIAPGGAAEARIADAFETELASPPFNPKEAAAAAFLDLASHPWAGMAVTLTLRVKDQAGQSAESETVAIVLPERIFNHPVARELATLRKALIADFTGNAPLGAAALDRILRAPDSFGGEPHVVLFLGSARGRLAKAADDAEARSVSDLIWHAALRIEDGNLIEAEQRLAAAEQALREAMERAATPREISELIDQLKRALAEYARELAERMPESQLSMLKPGRDQQAMGPEDIAEAMERLREMSQMGAIDAARDMMAQLQEMLQSLRSAATAPQDNAEVQEAQEIMRQLRDVTEKQSELLEQSFEKARQAALDGRKQNRREGDSAAAERQENLRQELGDLMGRMGEMAGEIPEGMGNAEAAMRRARDGLSSGSWKPASDAQGEALASLQESLAEANDQLMEALSEKGLAGMMPMPGRDRQGFDPLGRRTGPDNGENVELPEGPDAQGVSERVRAILEEIRRRASDRTRPVEEQDYLRRLMRRF
jgi:uncharacterized protein (TIGR02302 family)